MKFDPNDARLTAYVLNELDADEKAAVEKLLADSPEARAAVEEIRATVDVLSKELGAEPVGTLSDSQRETITSAKSRGGLRLRTWLVASAVAASLLIIAVNVMTPRLSRARELAEPSAPHIGPGAGIADLDAYGKAKGETKAVDEEGLNQLAALGYVGGADYPLEETVFDSRHAGGVLYCVQPAGSASGLNANYFSEADGDGLQDMFYGGGGECETLSGRMNTEAYDQVIHNAFLRVTDQPLSTFSIDVDTASYANVRRYLNSNHLPPPGAVRVEEFINYFTYDYAEPDTADAVAPDDETFSVTVDVADCPWTPAHRLMRVGLKGLEIEPEERPACNLVFLLDVSGSMQDDKKLPLVKHAMNVLIDQLGENDRVAIAVYAGASGLVLPSTTGNNAETIRHALASLRAGGSTNGGEGIELAYAIAEENFIEGGVNRVILATDGDFNVGVTNQGDLVKLIEQKAAGGVFLSVLGFGMGNYKDSTLEKLADQGNGNYAYIDTTAEAEKVFGEQLAGTLVTIAKDVKIQIEFNPLAVGAYRLIGYENRILAAEDFNDDTKDAGEIGAGHTVTALYELVPAGADEEIPASDGESPLPAIDPLKYQTAATPSAAADSGEMATIKLRYKQPDADTSELFEVPVVDTDRALADTSEDFRFAASVASFGMLLRHSPHAGNWTYDAVLELAEPTIGEDVHGYRAEFLSLVEKARNLTAE
ncbi:von Willebrand factor type A domain-containing protein [uncultured Ilyobacter sp.]|uniref:YfbK domain-containing protein n=1 Tax=uncultured Ilyobacter sp. TaxID=544433 RepID=UPI0029F53C25|nr:von Willebrand factor type A domain-containing protein [uncultured Ilyobacter sp.]